MGVYYIGSIPFDPNYLEHFGILGMKWGIRRFQNPDGTLTEAGKKRYGNYALQYRDKHGNETEAGKKRSEAYIKRFIDSTEVDSNGRRTFESINRYYEQEEDRIKKLFENSSNPKLRDPAVYNKVMDIWNKALFEEYSSDYSGTENPLATSADTASQVWGGSWHMPTSAQCQELTANTTYEWATINGVNGGKFTAQNGNYIFIPAGGSYHDGMLEGFNEYCNVWTSNSMDYDYNYSLIAYDSGLWIEADNPRRFAYFVRAVIG